MGSTAHGNDIHNVVEILQEEIRQLKQTIKSLSSESKQLPLNMKNWSCVDVCQWFRLAGFGKYIDRVIEKNVGGTQIQEMSYDEWVGIGISDEDIEKLRVLIRCYMLESGTNLLRPDDSKSPLSSISSIDSRHIDNDEIDERHLLSELKMELISSDPNGFARRPNNGDTVQVHYTISVQGANGELIEIENSRSMVINAGIKTSQTLEWVCGSGQVLKGWDLAIKTFEGRSRKLVTIPPSLAYGHRGHQPKISSDATLFCDIEIVDIMTPYN